MHRLRSAGRVRVEWIAITFAVVLLAGALLSSLGVRHESYRASGDGLDIRLIAVRPDAGDEWLDVAGRPLGARPFDGRDVKPWGSNILRRDFIFERPAGVVIWPASFHFMCRGQFMYGDRVLMDDVVTGRVFAVESAFPDFYWRPGFVFGGPRPLEYVDVVLSYHAPERDAPVLRFDGPFVPGRTNTARDAASAGWTCELVLAEERVSAGQTNARFVFASAGFPDRWSRGLTFVDTNGRRHRPCVVSGESCLPARETALEVSGLGGAQLAAAELLPLRTRTFHHVLVQYPDRPVLHAPAPRRP